MKIFKQKRPEDFWLIIILVIAIITAIIHINNLWSTVFVITTICVFVIFIAVMIYYFPIPFKRKHLRFSNIDYMDGHTFEYYVASLIKRRGFTDVHVTQASGDFGCDITANYMGQRCIFQCKRYNKSLGIKPIQEIYAAKTYYQADIAIVVTNSYFTPAAEELSFSTGVYLWDRNMLEKIKNKSLFRNNSKKYMRSGDTFDQ